MLRAWNRCSVSATSLIALGCAARAPEFASSGAALVAQTRRPPGILEVRTNTWPLPRRTGHSTDELCWLKSPASTALARQVVRNFLRAIVNENANRVESLLAPDAEVDTPDGSQPARSFWRARLASFDYTELRGQQLTRDSEIETFRSESSTQTPSKDRPPLALGPDDVAVRVPIRVSWNGRTRLFGDTLLFRLEPNGGTFDIAEIVEDFRLP